MKYLVFGSINIDKVYSVPHLPEKGETFYCNGYEVHVGGKGLNQALALQKAGCEVYAGGCIGEDGIWMKDYLENAGVDTSYIRVSDGYTGHTIIEVDPEGQNQMILYSGANSEITESDCDSILENFSAGDVILTQYETSQVEYMIKAAHDRGLSVVLNPSPYRDEVKDLPYELVDILVLNEFEGKSISGETDVDRVVSKLLNMMKGGTVILTLGGEGAVYADLSTVVKADAFKVEAVDTTGAGDTFTGYVLESLFSGKDKAYSLRKACAASAIEVTKRGAAETIPGNSEVMAFLENIS